MIEDIGHLDIYLEEEGSSCADPSHKKSSDETQETHHYQW